jgi:hypothetical protein
MSTNPQEDRVVNPFGTEPIVAAPSGATVALAQREASHIQAMAMAAQLRLRDPRAAMDNLLQACTRLTLAEKAEYTYARGGTEITGPTIRLMEEAARCWGRLLFGVAEISRSGGISECRAYCYDLENITGDERLFQVKHWRDTRTGGYVLTDERDIYEMIANYGARRKRACIESMIPGDVIAAARKQCAVTMVTKVELTPERIANMLKAFGEFKVTKEMIEKRIQRHLDTITPAGYHALGKIYNSLKDGVAKVTDFFELEPEAGAQTQTDKAKDAVRARQGKGTAKVPEPAAGETTSTGALPFFNQASATEALRACKDSDKLAEVMEGIKVDYSDTERPFPIELNAVYAECREVLEKKGK